MLKNNCKIIYKSAMMVNENLIKTILPLYVFLTIFLCYCFICMACFLLYI